MSAIAGILHLDGKPASRDVIARMLVSLAHRGSETTGIWCDGPAALAQGSRQTVAGRATVFHPATWPRSGLTVVADARIDNRTELAALLQLVHPEELSDCEFILSAYERWGSACAEKLIGDFAFVIWDSRRRAMYCARDAMGVKPFYYVASRRIFAFASEIKALLTLPDVSRELDEEQVALYLGWSQDSRDRTFYKELIRLPAAHHMTVAPSGVHRTEYWRLDPTREIRYASDAEYVEAFGEIFSDAVRTRLRNAAPVGATLSGGLDSSSIVCEARRQLAGQATPPELHTFSLVFPDVPSVERRLIDERAFADSVTQGGDLRAHTVRGDLLSPLSEVERVLWHQDEPYCAPNLYLHWGLYAAAQQRGVRVLLDGFDGDSVVSHGVGRLNTLARASHWDAFEAEVRAFAVNRQISPQAILHHIGLPYLSDLARRGKGFRWLEAATQMSRRFGLSRRHIAIDHGLRALVPRRVTAAWRAVLMGGTGEAGRAVLRRHVSRRLARHRATEAQHGGTERDLHRQGIDQPAYQLTLEIADKAAAAFGVEPRYPFFDRRLIEFCLALPEEQKFAGGWTRLILRRAMDGVLPADIQWRGTKANLSSNFHRRFIESDEAVVRQTDFTPLTPYVDLARLHDTFGRYRAEWTHRDSDADGCLLFRASVLAAWLGARSGSRSEAPANGPHTPVAA